MTISLIRLNSKALIRGVPVRLLLETAADEILGVALCADPIKVRVSFDALFATPVLTVRIGVIKRRKAQ
jgi:hypothetical protein